MNFLFAKKCHTYINPVEFSSQVFINYILFSSPPHLSPFNDIDHIHTRFLRIPTVRRITIISLLEKTLMTLTVREYRKRSDSIHFNLATMSLGRTVTSYRHFRRSNFKYRTTSVSLAVYDRTHLIRTRCYAEIRDRSRCREMNIRIPREAVSSLLPFIFILSVSRYVYAGVSVGEQKRMKSVRLAAVKRVFYTGVTGCYAHLIAARNNFHLHVTCIYLSRRLCFFIFKKRYSTLLLTVESSNSGRD